MSKQIEFLQSECWILSWNASVQRAVSYKKNINEKERKGFRQSIVNFCEEVILPSYIFEQSEEQHIANIVHLRDYAQDCAGSHLLAKPYSIGVSQKLLNLQLKYLWCLNLIRMPPHCPIDRIVLSHTTLKNRMNWTEISSVSEYRQIIEAIRSVAGDNPIAQWELYAYDRRR